MPEKLRKNLGVGKRQDSVASPADSIRGRVDSESDRDFFQATGEGGLEVRTTIPSCRELVSPCREARFDIEAAMKPNWQARSITIHERFVKLAQKKGKLTSDAEVLNFLALAICGEAGELANLVKKMWRGDDVDPAQIRDELADIRIYLEHICQHLNFDLDQACQRKLDEVADRLTDRERRASGVNH